MILEYKGIDVFYTDQGMGDAVILLHGFLENNTMWHDLTSQISIKNRVICIDLLGHGKSGCIGYIHTMEDMAEAVIAVIGHLEIKKYAIVGHSMGGYVALAIVEKYMNSVSRLCLMNSSALNDSDEKQVNRDRAIAAVKQNHRIFVKLAITNLFADINRVKLEMEINSVKDEALRMPLQGIIAALEGMKIRKNRTFLLKSSEFKKMMIIGRKDPVLEYDTLIEQTKNTNTEIVEFPDGHMSHIENKKELTYKIMQFIEK
ncbi:alpha/beta hydrolase [Flavobacteriales bacterium 34_180_T64]|nr:alpha/beta hydrolase [Flavobacteriales bacterium 34_180_T64]